MVIFHVVLSLTLTLKYVKTHSAGTLYSNIQTLNTPHTFLITGTYVDNVSDIVYIYLFGEDCCVILSLDIVPGCHQKSANGDINIHLKYCNNVAFNCIANLLIFVRAIWLYAKKP